MAPRKVGARGRFHQRLLEKINAFPSLLSKEEEKDLEKFADQSCNRWADLPIELVESILIRLPPSDVVRACSACTSWFSLLSTSPACLLRLPWLCLIPKIKRKRSFPYITFLSPNENLTFDVRLPFDIDKIRHSGIIGWLLVTDCNSIFHLLNPLNRVRISISRIPGFEKFKILSMSETNIKHNSFPSDLKILSRCSDNVYLYVMLGRGLISTFCFSYSVQDMNFYNHGKFFALIENGGILICDLNGPYPKIQRFSNHVLKQVASKHGIDATPSKSYLVQNSGEIYQFLMSCEDEHRLLGVFKLRINPDKFFISSSCDNVLTAEEKSYDECYREIEWVRADDGILQADRITILDNGKLIFIPAHSGCSFKYAAKHQSFHVNSFMASNWHLIEDGRHWVEYLRDNRRIHFRKLFWFMPASY